MNLLKKIIRKLIYEFRSVFERNDIEKLFRTFNSKGIVLDECNAEKIRDKRLSAIINYSVKNVPYYKNIFAALKHRKSEIKKNPCGFLRNFPILTREIIMQNNSKLKSKISWLYPCGISKTSGTTGIPLEFISSSPNGEYSHQMFLYEFMAGQKIALDKVVSFGGGYLSDECIKQNIFWQYEKGLYGSCLFSSFYILEKNIQFYVEKLNEINPQIIRSYPSSLLLFIDYCKKLNIKPNIDVKGIYLTSENSTKEQMEKISDFFGCGVYGQYGHSEACIFAFTTKNDTVYYCSPFYGFVEVLDKDNQPVKIGETGYVTVSTFRNKAMPFIRYRTGDLAVYGGEKNGYAILRQLLGREKDYILNKDGEKIFIIVGQFSECFLPAICHVKYWQAIQNEKGKMLLKIVRKDSFTQNNETDILKVTQDNKIETVIEYVDEIPLTKAGKRKYIVNSLY